MRAFRLFGLGCLIVFGSAFAVVITPWFWIGTLACGALLMTVGMVDAALSDIRSMIRDR